MLRCAAHLPHLLTVWTTHWATPCLFHGESGPQCHVCACALRKLPVVWVEPTLPLAHSGNAPPA